MDEEVNLDLNENGKGHFYINENGEKIAEMEIGISANLLTAYHTEVLPKAEGRGMAKKLFNEMVRYATENKLKVKPLCSYVHAQLNRNPEAYKSIWKEEE